MALKMRTGQAFNEREENIKLQQRLSQEQRKGKGTEGDGDAGGKRVDLQKVPDNKRMVQRTTFKTDKRSGQSTVTLGSLSYSHYFNHVLPVLREWLGGLGLTADEGFSILINTKSDRSQEVVLIGKAKKIKVNVRSGDPKYMDKKVDWKIINQVDVKAEEERRLAAGHSKYGQGGFMPLEEN